MNFLSHKSCAEEGDTAIVYLTFANIYSIKLARGEVFQTKYGALKHDDVIGRRYGTKVECSRGYVYVLFVTPELWTLTLPHRTQILYTRDISFVTLQLDLKPGSVVCEAGTGSGSMSHALARTVAPGGQVHTFDFHEHRAQLARQEFEEHGLGEVVKASHRDVCQDGFGIEGVADAIFLDLPHPWEAVDAAARALNRDTGGRLCSFSPCIEQVQRTCSALRSRGFVDLVTWECLERPYEVKPVSMADVCKVAPLGPPRKKNVGRPNPEGPAAKDLGTGMDTSEDTTTSELVPEVTRETVPAAEPEGEPDAEPEVREKRKRASSPGVDAGHFCFHTAIPSVQAPGHTGYLTFATWLAS